MSQNAPSAGQIIADHWRELKTVVLKWLAVIGGAGLGISTLLIFISARESHERVWIIVPGLMLLIISWTVIQRDQLQIAAHLMFAGLGLLIISGALVGVGVYSASYQGFIVLIMLSSVLYNPRITIITTTIAIGYGGVLVVLAGETSPDSPLSPVYAWVTQCVLFCVAASFMIAIRTATQKIISQIEQDRTFYQTIISDQTEYIVRWKPDGTRTFVNDAYCRYFELTPEEAIGTSFVPLIAEEHRPYFYAKLERLTPNHPVEIHQQQVINPDGTLDWQQWTDRAVFDRQGNLTEYQSVGRDITHLMELEQNRLDLKMSRRRERFLRDFLNMISHDLKTPLTIIENNLYLIRHTSESPAVEKHANRIERQIDHLTVMINDILTSARLENVEYLDMEPVELRAILDEARQSLVDACELKHIDLTIVEPLPPIALRGDEKYLKRAFINLLENAIKYSPRESIVKIAGSSDGEQRATITITDSGMGIDAEDLPHIFERFYRAKNVREIERGTGLGLAIVSRVIELHGGNIAVDSIPGNGSTFTVKLPLYQKKNAVPVSAQADL